MNNTLFHSITLYYDRIRTNTCFVIFFFFCSDFLFARFFSKTFRICLRNFSLRRKLTRATGNTAHCLCYTVCERMNSDCLRSVFIHVSHRTTNILYSFPSRATRLVDCIDSANTAFNQQLSWWPIALVFVWNTSDTRFCLRKYWSRSNSLRHEWMNRTYRTFVRIGEIQTQILKLS